MLVDGYNVLGRHAAWRRHAPAQARRHLLDALADARWPVPVGAVHVIFDGPCNETPVSSPVLRVQFASPSADAAIGARLRAARASQRLLLVTDDSELVSLARAHGVTRQSCAWLLGRLEAAQAKPAAPSANPALSAAVRRRITEDLARQWLGRGRG